MVKYIIFMATAILLSSSALAQGIPLRNEQAKWIPARPIEATVSKDGTARILEDYSVRLEGDVRWQEASLQFAFDKSASVEEIRLEILSVDSPAGPQFGRGGRKLMLFDVKPSIEDQAGQSSSLDFTSCTYLHNPGDETTASCIDHLTDTGWNVPNLPPDAVAHELVLRFEKPIRLHAGQRLTLTVDSGGADELAVLNRIRFAFHQAAVSEPADDEDENALVPRGVETGTVVLHALDADSGEPIPNVTFVIENLKAEEWASSVGKSGDDGKRQLEMEPKPGCFFSVHPMPDGYQVTGLDEVPAGVVVGGRVEHRFHLRKRGTNADFPEVLPAPETARAQLPVPSEFTKRGSIRSSVDNMPGFAGQQIEFVYDPKYTEMAERVFRNGRRVRAALDDELEYFCKAEGEKAGDITEISDVLIAIQANQQWFIRCRTSDGMNLRDGFKVHFNNLEGWDLKVPSYVHPEF